MTEELLWTQQRVTERVHIGHRVQSPKARAMFHASLARPDMRQLPHGSPVQTKFAFHPPRHRATCRTMHTHPCTDGESRTQHVTACHGRGMALPIPAPHDCRPTRDRLPLSDCYVPKRLPRPPSPLASGSLPSPPRLLGCCWGGVRRPLLLIHLVQHRHELVDLVVLVEDGLYVHLGRGPGPGRVMGVAVDRAASARGRGSSVGVLPASTLGRTRAPG